MARWAGAMGAPAIPMAAPGWRRAHMPSCPCASALLPALLLLSCPSRIDLTSQTAAMSHARLVGCIQHWLQPDCAVLGVSAPWDSALMQKYKDCTSPDDEMDRVIGELLDGRRRSALDDCLRLTRWAGWG